MRLERLSRILTLASAVGIAALVGLFALSVGILWAHERDLRALAALAARADALSAAGDATLLSWRGPDAVASLVAEADVVRFALLDDRWQPALVAEATAAIDRMVAIAEAAWSSAGTNEGERSPLGVPASTVAAMETMADAGLALDAIMVRLFDAHQADDLRRTLGTHAGFGLAALLFGVLSLLVLRLLHLRVGAPLLQTVEAVERFAAGDRDARTRIMGPDEVGSLGTSIDALMVTVAAHEDDLRASNERLGLALAKQHTLFDALPANVAVVDAAGVITDVNGRWRAHGEASGRPTDASDVGIDYLSVCDAAAARRSEGAVVAAQGLRSVLSGREPAFGFEYPCHAPDRATWYRMSVSPIPGHDAGPAGAVVMHVDVTVRKLAELALEEAANRDDLTGLLSRAGFVGELTALLDGRGWSRDAVVATLDVADFRSVNNAHGFGVGDLLLRAIAARLADELGAGGLAARANGDTFLVYAAARAGEDAAGQIARLARAATRPYEVNDFPHEIEVAIGYTALGGAPRAVEELIREAELALYDGQGHPGTSAAAYTAELDAAAHERVRVTHELRLALARDEFVLEYQPQVALGSGRLVGAEALVRWRHPERGLVPPGAFVPVAEQSGLIVPLGSWVLHEACRALARWREAGLRAVPVAVNVSVEQLTVGDFASDVETALRAAGVAPELLTLEITESVFMRESKALFDQLERLHDLGVRLALDDFGTGFSSLQYLKAYRFDEVKVDRAFVRDMVHDGFSHGLVTTVLGLARAMGAAAVAEGIEGAPQAEALLAMGCTRAQGYHFSVPLPEADFQKLVAEEAALPVAKALET